MSARAELEAARKTMLNSLAEAYIFQQKLDPTQAADLARVNEFKTSLEKDGFSDPAKLTSYMESLGNTDLIKEAHRGYTRALTAFEKEPQPVTAQPAVAQSAPAPAVPAKMAGQQPQQDKWMQAGLGKILEKTGLTIEEYAKAKGLTSPDQLEASVKQDVAALQSELRDGGHPAGKFGQAHDGVDGKWGPATENALGQAGGKSAYLEQMKVAAKAASAAPATPAKPMAQVNDIVVPPPAPQAGQAQPAADPIISPMDAARQSATVMGITPNIPAQDAGKTVPDAAPKATPNRHYAQPREMAI